VPNIPKEFMMGQSKWPLPPKKIKNKKCEHTLELILMMKNFKELMYEKFCKILQLFKK
jgi:hypothetical protein